MPLQDVDRLRNEWTDRRVVVAIGRPSLRRFSGHVGNVVTVNMNGRALVRFDIPADNSWYDISLDDLTLTADTAPSDQPAPSAPTTPEPSSPTQTTRKPDSPPSSSAPLDVAKTASILELARQQGAAKRF